MSKEFIIVLCVVGYIVIGAITAFIAGLIDDGNDDFMACGIFWPFVLVGVIIGGAGWLVFVGPYVLAKKLTQPKSVYDDNADFSVNSIEEYYEEVKDND